MLTVPYICMYLTHDHQYCTNHAPSSHVHPQQKKRILFHSFTSQTQLFETIYKSVSIIFSYSIVRISLWCLISAWKQKPNKFFWGMCTCTCTCRFSFYHHFAFTQHTNNPFPFIDNFCSSWTFPWRAGWRILNSLFNYKFYSYSWSDICEMLH